MIFAFYYKGICFMDSLKTTSKRNINIEILRILTMFSIVLGHRIGHDGVYEACMNNVNSFSYFLRVTIFSATIPVHIFFIISGYFLVSSKPKTKKIFNIWRTVLFYSVLMFFISIVIKFFVNRGFLGMGLNPEKLNNTFIPSWNSKLGNIRSFGDWIDAFFPISRSAYGFFSLYCALYLFSPVLNKLLRSLNKKQYQYFLIIISLTVSILPTIFYNDFLATSSTGGFIWAVYMYVVAGYLRLHFDIYSIKRRNYLITFIIMILSRVVFFVVLDNIAINLGKERAIFNSYFNGHDNFVLVIATSCLLCYFLTMEKKPRKCDSFTYALSSLTFGIYLMHDNLFTRNYMWDVLPAERLSGTTLMWPAVIFDVAVIFLFCGSFDFIRQKLFKKWDEISADFRIIKKRDELFSKIDSIFAD